MSRVAEECVHHPSSSGAMVAGIGWDAVIQLSQVDHICQDFDAQIQAWLERPQSSLAPVKIQVDATYFQRGLVKTVSDCSGAVVVLVIDINADCRGDLPVLMVDDSESELFKLKFLARCEILGLTACNWW